jgi:hypothetical protein
VSCVTERLKISGARFVAAVEEIHDDRVYQNDKQIGFLRVSKDPPNLVFISYKVMEVKEML